jgi:hypothetical protein
MLKKFNFATIGRLSLSNMIWVVCKGDRLFVLLVEAQKRHGGVF